MSLRSLPARATGRPWLLTLALCAVTATAAQAQPKRAMTVDDLLAVKSVSDPQLSPDGAHVVYVVSEVDKDANKSNSSLWLVPTAGGEPKRITTTPGTNNHPRWSPDGKTIVFVSSRGGSSQLWLLGLDGGEPRALTQLPIDVGGPVWSPQGDKIAFAAEVIPGQSPEETAAADKAREGAKSKALIFDDLMVRHWQSWTTAKRSHLFVLDVKSGKVKDLTPKWTANVPPGPFGGSEEYAWSPDGAELAFTSEPLQGHAWSTNSDIWIVPSAGGEPENFTSENPGADGQPAFSPDGKALAYVSQARAGFEADQWVLTLKRRAGGPARPLTKELDRPIQAFEWADDGKALLAVIDDGGQESLVRIESRGGADAVMKLVQGHTNTAAQAGPKGAPLVFLRSQATHPAEIHVARADGSNVTALTHHNDGLVAGLDLNPAESFTFSGADGDSVQGWLVKPPGFDPAKKYPVLFLIHGGPQGAWHDEWHARWNYGLFAAPGYVVVAVNPRGSTGFGQKFTDQISGDWAGRVYQDLMTGLDHALKTYPFLDGDRLGAAGGSYGGYMVNWILGHTDRFKALISHAGVFDTHSKYFTTEELWFPEWEFGGVPWEQRENYFKVSPSHFVADFKTPTLVTHGALDYRVSDNQGLGLFTALKRRGVPARLVLFPDEGHWILKPGNRIVWWNEMHGWLGQYLKPGSN